MEIEDESAVILLFSETQRNDIRDRVRIHCYIEELSLLQTSSDDFRIRCAVPVNSSHPVLPPFLKQNI